MDPITALIKFYKKESQDFLKDTKAGKKYKVQGNVFVAGRSCTDREKKLADKLGIDNVKVWELRRTAIAPLLYDSVVEADKSLKDETLKDDGLGVLVDRIDSTLVAEAHTWLKQNGGLEGISRESFYHWFDGTGRMVLNTIMTGINALRVAAEYPDKIEQIEEGRKMPAQAVHRLFVPKKRKISIPKLQLEIAEAIYPVIPEGTPQEIVDAINSAGDFLFATKKGRPEYHTEHAGKYKLPGELYLVWRNARYEPMKTDPNLEAEIDGKFRPTKEREIELKRVVYSALYKCLAYIDSVTADSGKIIVKLPTKSPFNLPITKLLKLKDLARDFAINQVLYSWVRKEDWSENSHIRLPELAMSIGISANGNPRGIYIKHGGATHYFGRSTGRVQFKNTIAYLPGAAFYVKQFHEGAKSVLEKPRS
jgi:hypothetical protein